MLTDLYFISSKMTTVLLVLYSSLLFIMYKYKYDKKNHTLIQYHIATKLELSTIPIEKKIMISESKSEICIHHQTNLENENI